MLKTLIRDLHHALIEIRAAARRRDRFIRVSPEKTPQCLISANHIFLVARRTVEHEGKEKFGAVIFFHDERDPLHVFETVEVIEAMLA